MIGCVWIGNWKLSELLNSLGLVDFSADAPIEEVEWHLQESLQTSQKAQI